LWLAKAHFGVKNHLAINSVKIAPEKEKNFTGNAINNEMKYLSAFNPDYKSKTRRNIEWG
jgi:hypothetical protein